MMYLSSYVCVSMSVCPTLVCIRTHKNDHVRSFKILQSKSEFDPVVQVRVRWIAETRKDSACTLLTEG